jgi:hypothetical protein
MHCEWCSGRECRRGRLCAMMAGYVECQSRLRLACVSKTIALDIPAPMNDRLVLLAAEANNKQGSDDLYRRP